MRRRVAVAIGAALTIAGAGIYTSPNPATAAFWTTGLGVGLIIAGFSIRDYTDVV